MERLRYEEEEAQEILRIAARRQTGPMSRADLLASAAELGISPADVEAAEAQYRAERDERSEYEAFLVAQRRGWNSHAISFVLVMLALTGVNLLATPGQPWILFVLLGWGLGFLFHTVATFGRNTGLHHEAFEEFRSEHRKPREEPE